MVSPIKIVNIYPETFKANLYTVKPFRMIGLVDVSISYPYGIEKVTLAFFRSSGTNSGKIQGLWYPIVGIKTYTGRFTEFTEFVNFVLTYSTRNGEANKGWLAKSLFFSNQNSDNSKIRGFSNGKHYKSLLEIGETLRDLYEKNNYYKMVSLNPKNLNSILTSEQFYQNNAHFQRENYEKFIEDIFNEDIYKGAI